MTGDTRFDESVFKMYKQSEDLLLKAAYDQTQTKDLRFVINVYDTMAEI